MLRRVLSAMLLAAVCGGTVAQAQTVAQVGGPAELPPPGFSGQMYVDSRGCVFLRAGLAGRTTWVPRVSKDRKALCGYPPTREAMARPVPVAEPATVAEAPAPRATGKPMQTVATLTTPPRIKVANPPKPSNDPYLTRAVPAGAAARPVVVAAPAPVAVQPRVAAPAAVAVPAARVAVAQPQKAPVAAQPQVAFVPGRPGPGKLACFESAPVAQVVALSNGGTAVLCTRGDGTLNGARAPIYDVVAMGEGARSGAGIYAAPGRSSARAAAAPARIAPAGIASAGIAPAAPPAAETVPEGYKLAWTDDRLNPRRGMGTPQGQAEQDQVWTRQVPAQLVAPQAPAAVTVASAGQPRRTMVQVSTKTEASAPVAAEPVAARGEYYVQVGSFGVPENAEGARARLRAAGLPVGTATVTRKGKALQMVMAGPFADAGAAQAALRAARGAGFGDAFIR